MQTPAGLAKVLLHFNFPKSYPLEVLKPRGIFYCPRRGLRNMYDWDSDQQFVHLVPIAGAAERLSGGTPEGPFTRL